jgi:cephalosporin hydroxylase
MWLRRKKNPPLIAHHSNFANHNYDNTGSGLRQFANSITTDKDTWHSYLGVYETLFEDIKDTATRIMEIGVSEGGSINMWSNYFTNAEIYGADIDLSRMHYTFTDPRIKLYNGNAYDQAFVDSLEQDSFDAIIDDGPHTLESMIQFVNLYPKLLKPNGLLIIEDVQSADWIPQILKNLPNHMIQSSVVFDRRHLKNRYDDIQIVCRNTPDIVGI